MIANTNAGTKNRFDKKINREISPKLYKIIGVNITKIQKVSLND